MERIENGYTAAQSSTKGDIQDVDNADSLIKFFSFLQITEKGTEAAAATSGFSFYLGPMFTVTFDRPFFLFIYDALNKVSGLMDANKRNLSLSLIKVVIFWARVVDPEPLAAVLTN